MRETFKKALRWLTNHKELYAVALPWTLAIFFLTLSFYKLCKTLGLL